MSDDSGPSRAIAQFEHIKTLVDALREAEEAHENRDGVIDRGAVLDRAREAIQEDALSVEVRGGWHAPGGDNPVPIEYNILLCTGGPAVRIIGTLNAHGEPTEARLEYQNWFTPWIAARYHDLCALADKSVPAGSVSGDAIEAVKAYLLTYARQFYFGEG